MTWIEFILLINMQAEAFCNSLIHFNPNCQEQIVECALDGESIEWCTENYAEEK